LSKNVVKGAPEKKKVGTEKINQLSWVCSRSNHGTVELSWGSKKKMSKGVGEGEAAHTEKNGKGGISMR